MNPIQTHQQTFLKVKNLANNKKMQAMLVMDQIRRLQHILEHTNLLNSTLLLNVSMAVPIHFNTKLTKDLYM